MWETREPYRGDGDNSHTSLDLRESMTDLQKLLNNSDPLKSAIRRFQEQEALLKDASFSTPAAYLEQQKELARTLTGETIADITRLSSGSLSEQMRRDVLSCAYMPSSISETLAEMTKKELKSDADALAWLKAADPTNSLAGSFDFKELERVENERRLNEMAQFSMEHNQHIMRQAAEAQSREKAKVEYARRSAEASEAVLAAEREGRKAAEKDAEQSKEAAKLAEERAERSERREIAMQRLARIAVVTAFAALLVAAWPFIRESMGW